MGVSAVDHHESNRVIDDAEHRELSMDAINSLAAQDIHPHRRLEITQVRLDLPSVTIEFGHGLLGIPFGIKQRGNERLVRSGRRSQVSRGSQGGASAGLIHSTI